MDLDRARLKAELAHRRKVWRVQPRTGQLAFMVVCDLCGRADPTDLHENLVTRGDSQGNDALQQRALTSEVNLHLLCNHCNTRLAMIETCRDWLASLNLYRYGLVPTQEWLASLPFSQDRTPYLALVERVYADMGGLNYYTRWKPVLAALLSHRIDPQPYPYEEVRLWQSRFSRARA